MDAEDEEEEDEDEDETAGDEDTTREEGDSEMMTDDINVMDASEGATADSNAADDDKENIEEVSLWCLFVDGGKFNKMIFVPEFSLTLLFLPF